MQTRRAFVKTLLGLGALGLPWSLGPSWLGDTIKKSLGYPPVDLAFPPSTKMNILLEPESLSRSAADDIQTLTGAEMQGRKAGTVGEARAARYLSAQLSMLGLKPLGDLETGFAQGFTIPPVSEGYRNGRLTFIPEANQELRTPSVNLLGELMGVNQQEVILLSAHYDHLGVFAGQLYPGANDNASGVGCVLDVIRRILRERKTPRRSIVIAFWSAEEMGYVGSKAFVKNPTFPLNQIKAVLNVDTVGNGMIGDFALWADGENIAVQAIRQAAERAGASALLTPPSGHDSDSVSFAEADIPAVTLMARAWLNRNHTPEDTPALLKPEQINLAADILYRAVYLLAF